MKRWAMAKERSPASRATRSLVTGSIATQTQWGDRDKRLIALAWVITISHRTEHGIQLIELQLSHVQLTEEIGGKGRELLGRFRQPSQHGVGGDLEDPCGGANTEALGSARQHVYNQLHGNLLAMNNRAMVLREISVARRALELAPLATIGMAVGA